MRLKRHEIADFEARHTFRADSKRSNHPKAKRGRIDAGLDASDLLNRDYGGTLGEMMDPDHTGNGAKV